MTTEIKLVEGRVKCIDTPGIADSEINISAVKQINEKYGPEFLFVFVMTLSETGEVIPEELAGISMVIEATGIKDNQFLVIINKIPRLILQKMNADKGFKDGLEVLINKALPVKTNFIKYLPYIQKLEEEKCAQMDLAVILESFLSKCYKTKVP
eukprot:CAMPEP_0176411190 /NCGR_PEP_ID=MMETSP0127-20121128/3472_1 /TAXON_ID=938130 /ORGANISM="Platyophrya macrostoma, Strain WH" /LENGTH=153 /DNA_ID=CAMNT_0017790765 /DNA_START=201 /DNA_END=658 /DNA_ORIENTATION=+